MTEERHFLAWRNRGGLRKVEVYEDQIRALREYDYAEQGLGAGEEVCLFGADSLATLCRTHPSWFCPETIDVHALLEESNG